MDHTEKLTRYTAAFVDELVYNGLTDVVISPGSRSTPLAMLMCEHPDISEWILIDERSAAFFALGMAKAKQKPVALVCTSGTATANYFPAIIEAAYSYIPLVVLTADRPHELRDNGAPQAIEQINLYGSYSKWFHDMALPEGSPQMLSYVRHQAARAVQMSEMDNAGPVHLNFPFREPLIPDLTLDNLWGQSKKSTGEVTYRGSPILVREHLDFLMDTIHNKQSGLIICGPQDDPALADVIIALAEKIQVPVLADPLSHIRSGLHKKSVVIETYDALLRSSSFNNHIELDYVIRFGAMPVSKSLRQYIEKHPHIKQFVIESQQNFRNPTNQQATFIQADPIVFCESLSHIASDNEKKSHWLSKWQKMNSLAKSILNSQHEMFTEGSVVQTLFKEIPNDSILFVGNSMAIRDVDTFFMTTQKEIKVLANRGTNGIDGVVSSSLGAVASTKKHVTLLIGDLSFYHDLNGLLTAKQYNLNITIVLINNNGGGIFSFLPQASNGKHFEKLFGTPLDIDFKHAISMYGGSYELVETTELLHKSLKSSYQNKSGLNIIEVQTSREENVTWHRTLWESINQSIIEYVDYNAKN